MTTYAVLTGLLIGLVLGGALGALVGWVAAVDARRRPPETPPRPRVVSQRDRRVRDAVTAPERTISTGYRGDRT